MDDYVTQTQFNDVCSRIFMLLDEMNKKMDRQHQQLRTQIDYVGTQLGDFKIETRQNFQHLEKKLDDFITKTEPRIRSLEDWRSKVQH